MATSLNQKLQRLLRLLAGLRDPRVVAAVQRYGFGEDDYEEGWRLLRAPVAARLDRPAPPPEDLGLERLDRWENRWSVVIKATLERHHPRLAQQLLANLGPTSGVHLLHSVPRLLDRIEALGRGRGDTEGKQARALLARRGLTDAVIAEARAELARLNTQSAPQQPALDPEAVAAAEAAMWAYYREWSRILRLELRDRRLLRELGLISVRRAAGADEDDEEEPAAASEGASAG